MDTTQPLQWKSLPEDKQKEIVAIYRNIKLLTEFGNKANFKLFTYLFGEQMGKHFWEKFCHANRNITAFMGLIDSDYQAVILTNVFGQKDNRDANPLYAHCQ